jgi:hypothetical protein
MERSSDRPADGNERGVEEAATAALPGFRHQRERFVGGTPTRVLDIDWIIATREEWGAAAQSGDGSWTVRPVGDFVLALKPLW